MRVVLIFLAVALAACSADPSAAPTSDAGACPFANAPGVVRVNSFPTPCTYVCDEEHSVIWCDVANACTSITVNGNCGACGVTCTAGQVCRQSTGSSFYRCLPPL